jgi:hypothetical protein
MPFKIHPHDDTWDRWITEGRDGRDELRNLISLHLKKRLGQETPDFFFVLEDRATSGAATRPHAHGSIGLVRASIPAAGRGSRSLRKMADTEGLEKAEIEAGRLVIKAALKAAAGAHLQRIAAKTGIDQGRNAWSLARPYNAIFNHQYVDYAFRNTVHISNRLGDSRLAMTNPLRSEAKRLWVLIRDGESALSQWDV